MVDESTAVYDGVSVGDELDDGDFDSLAVTER